LSLVEIIEFSGILIWGFLTLWCVTKSDKKIVSKKCQCGVVMFPPRERCINCEFHEKRKKEIVVPEEEVVEKKKPMKCVILENLRVQSTDEDGEEKESEYHARLPGTGSWNPEMFIADAGLGIAKAINQVAESLGKMSSGQGELQEYPRLCVEAIQLLQKSTKMCYESLPPDQLAGALIRDCDVHQNTEIELKMVREKQDGLNPLIKKICDIKNYPINISERQILERVIETFDINPKTDTPHNENQDLLENTTKSLKIARDQRDHLSKFFEDIREGIGLGSDASSELVAEFIIGKVQKEDLIRSDMDGLNRVIRNQNKSIADLRSHIKRRYPKTQDELITLLINCRKETGENGLDFDNAVQLSEPPVNKPEECRHDWSFVGRTLENEKTYTCLKCEVMMIAEI